MFNPSLFHPTATCINSTVQEPCKLYKNVTITDSSLGHHISVGDDSIVLRSKLEDHVIINRKNYIDDSSIGRFSYTGLNCFINFAVMGRFCSISRNVDIGGFDHDPQHVSTLPLSRFEYAVSGTLKEENRGLCQIGNDVWIGAGAIILRKARLGDGCIIGAGSVVTRSIPPYAIAVGSPARVIGFRFPQHRIDDLLRIGWWDWPQELILENKDLLFGSTLTEESFEQMKELSAQL